MYSHILRAASILAGGLLLCAMPALAQSASPTIDPPRPDETAEEDAPDEPSRYDELTQRFKTPALSIGVVVQAVGTFVLEDAYAPDPFEIDRARLKVSGDIGDGFGYVLQADITRSPALVDARVSYTPIPTVRFSAGRYNVPFSLEELTSAARIDFVNRSRVVRTLAPGRDIGASFELSTPSKALRFRAGAFNAIYNRSRNDEPVNERQPGDLLFAGRLAYRTPSSSSSAFQLQIGANAGYETPGDSELGEVPAHLIAGADLRLNAGPVLLATEGIIEYADVDGFEQRRDGYYVTLGYNVHEHHRLLARLDVFESSEALVFGYNVRLSRAALVRTDLVVPLDAAAGATSIIASAQIAF